MNADFFEMNKESRNTGNSRTWKTKSSCFPDFLIHFLFSDSSAFICEICG